MVAKIIWFFEGNLIEKIEYIIPYDINHQVHESNHPIDVRLINSIAHKVCTSSMTLRNHALKDSITLI